MSRTRIILIVAFGSLILLLGAGGFAVQRHARAVLHTMSALHESHQTVERILTEVPTDIHLSGVLVRDFLLDPTHIAADYYRQRLAGLRENQERRLRDLEGRIGAAEVEQLAGLRNELRAYWESLDPLFDWNPRQKAALSSTFLRNHVLPRRQAVIQMAEHAQELNRAQWRRQERDIDLGQDQFRSTMVRSLGAALALGLIVAVFAVARISQLERKAEEHRRNTEHAERELRLLSQQLVHAQEEERRRISRELHDEVGQKLTALRVDLGHLERLRAAPGGAFDERLTEARRIAEESMRLVRDIAMGLRPSMLDDLGLGPALEWQAREFSRRGLPVTVTIDGVLEGIPESHSTCVYRVVQEALTNCARHAQASQVRVAVHRHNGRAVVMIQDNGVGFDPYRAGNGLGLIGIQERVRELGGSVRISSQPGRGTALAVEIPAPGAS
jgi:signal transduction histidine kinase